MRPQDVAVVECAVDVRRDDRAFDSLRDGPSRVGMFL